MASDPPSREGGRLALIGLGPGLLEHLTGAALAALREAEVVIGYRAYVDQVQDLLAGKRVISRPIGEELVRATEAIELALEGQQVALVSGGDAGVYGMAGPLFEVLQARGWTPTAPPRVTVIPGVTAAQAAAAALGAPLMHDAASISLSDLLTPWEVIARRVEAAASADFVIAFYNPSSQRRTTQLPHALEIIGQYRPSETPVAFVRDAGRASEQITVTSLTRAHEAEVDMRTIVIVGSSQTRRLGDLLFTPRGYAPKLGV